MIADALAALRARRGRTILAALGVLAASLVVGTATTVGYSLATGFDRAAERADLPDVIARFSGEQMRDIDPRVSALPNLETRSYRHEALNHPLRFGSKTTRQGRDHHDARRPPRLRDRRRPRPARRDHGRSRRRARAGARVGHPRRRHADPDPLPGLRVVGIAISPDNVAYPLASAARVYITAEQTRGRPRHLTPNVAMLWLNDPSKADVTLTQARSMTFGVGELQFITRAGVEILLSQAAGIVISLLIAFSLVALVAAGTMLAAGAHADVQRRLTGLGVQRALGFGPGRIAAQQATEATLVAVPAAALGIVLGALIVARPAAELLAALNELGPGAALAGPLADRAGRRRRGRRRRRHVAGVARRAPAADRDPARRRPRPRTPRVGATAAASSRSASASPPRPARAGSRPSRRSRSVPAS